MQEGIGRTGYRVLAVLLLALGVAGLAAVLYGYGFTSPGTHFLGFALCAVAVGGLFALLAVALAAPPAAAASVPPPPRPLDLDLAPPNPGASVIELGDDEDAPEAGPGEPIPVQPNRNLARDTKGWPGRKPPSGVTRGEAKARATASTAAPRRAAARPPGEPLFEPVGAVSVPARRAASPRAPSEPPTVLARETTPRGAAPPGMAKGQCGTCGTYLLAPAVRPLKLRCPSCQKVTTLS